MLCRKLIELVSAIQIAKYMGYSPILTTSSLKHTKYLQSIGATHVLDRDLSDDETTAKIKSIIGDSTTLNLVFDAVDSPNKQVHVNWLAPNGVFMNSMAVPDDLKLFNGRKALGTFGVSHMYKSFGTEMYSKLSGFLEKGIIKVSRSG